MERPTLSGQLGDRQAVTLRPGSTDDLAALHAILAEQSVSRWWGEPMSVEELSQALLAGDSEEVLLVIEVDGRVAGGIQYSQEDDPMYRHAAIDIFVSTGLQGRGVGPAAVALLARHLIEEHGHHRLTIDPAASNSAAIRCYAKVGFRPVGVLRAYERGPDGVFRDGLLMDLLAPELIIPN